MMGDANVVAVLPVSVTRSSSPAVPLVGSHGLHLQWTANLRLRPGADSDLQSARPMSVSSVGSVGAAVVAGLCRHQHRRRHRALCVWPTSAPGSLLLPAASARGGIATASSASSSSSWSHASAADAIREALGSMVPPPRPAGSEPGQLRPLIVAMGTRGDVEPCLRLASALRVRGHLPLVLSHAAYEEEITKRWGLDFRSCSIDKVPLSEEYFTSNTTSEQVYVDRGWYGDAWIPVGRKLFEAAKEHKCDVIISTNMGNTHALDVAEQIGLLCFGMKFCPDVDGQVPTGTFPPSGYPAGMPGPLNAAAHVLENLRTIAAVFRGGFIPKVIAFRKELGLPAQKLADDIEVPVYSPYRQALQAQQPCLYAFSEALLQRPPEYQSWHFVTGAMGRADSSSEPGELPSELEHFLAEAEARGTKIVCIAFGSMTLARSHPFQVRAVSAARGLGARVVIIDPDTREEGHLTSDGDVFCARSVPYASLFPRCSLVVHHGGAGTLQDCLWAGTPQLAAPVLRFGDQPLWGRALEEKGIGVCLGEGGRAPEAVEWQRALETVLDNLEAFRSAATDVAARAAAEQGAEAACDVLEGALLSAA
mmetsp:Transcript_94777/g.171130  ORF Transcript_94777/g.171130 Transcript_94777/m.171130 type:complete len:592 (-) Transcript_94777:41-1816(-)